MTHDDKKDVDNTKTSTRIMTGKIYELKQQGYSNLEIARLVGKSPVTVSRALNSPTGKAMLKNASDKISHLVEAAIEVMEASLLNHSGDMTNAQRAAIAVLKNFGLLKDTIDMNHNFPKPTVVKRLSDGTEVVLGTHTDTNANDENED